MKFHKNELSLDYSDPHLFIGLHPIGKLFQRAAGIYFIGLTVYVVATIGAHYRFGLVSYAFFIGAWILGFALFFVPQLTIHFSMKKMKEKKLIEIEKRIRKEKGDKGGFLFPRKFKDEKTALEYIYAYLEYNHADKLKLYPFDISTIRDLMLMAIIPISAEICIRIYFHYMGI